MQIAPPGQKVVSIWNSSRVAEAVSFCLVAAALIGVPFLCPSTSLARSQSQSDLSLEEQLRAEYKLTTIKWESGRADVGTQGVVLVIQKGGILGVQPGSAVICPAKFEDGQLKAPTGFCRAMVRSASHELGTGESVYVTKVDVNVKKGQISFFIIECDACNGGSQASSYKSDVVFQFNKDFLETASVNAVEQTIGAVFGLKGESALGGQQAAAGQTVASSETAGTSSQSAPPNQSGNEQQAEVSSPRNPTQGTLQNEDIVKMLAAGLPQEVVIAKIKTSLCQFDTSPDALIKLKEKGASAALLTAMMERGKVPTPTNSGPATTTDVPSSYGYYVFDGARYQELTSTPVSVVMGIHTVISSEIGYAVDGFRGDPAQSFFTQKPVFIVYQQNVNIAAAHLSKLQFVSQMRAFQFNFNNTSPQFFSNVYGVDYNQPVSVNLWRTEPNYVPMKTQPVAGRDGMFRIVPETALEPGRYALFFGDLIRPASMIFAARAGASQGDGFYFAIGTSKSSP